MDMGLSALLFGSIAENNFSSHTKINIDFSSDMEMRQVFLETFQMYVPV